MTHRSTEVEVMDDPDLPDEVLAEAHRHITRVNRWLGNTRSIIEWVRHDPEVRRVLDLGCGDGAILADIRAALGVEVQGVDLRPPLKTLVPVITGDAARDALPQADVAISVLTAHHMSDADVLGMMRNAAKSCRRLIILDLVRHPIPEKLFRWFLAPFLPGINRQDGEISVRRAFTAAELFALAEQSGADRIVHQVAPLNLRQIIELTWKKGCRPSPDSDPRSSS